MAEDPIYPKNKVAEQSALQDQAKQQGQDIKAAALFEVMKNFAAFVDTEQDGGPIDTGKRLSDQPRFRPVTVAFPPCSTEMLALIRTTGVTGDQRSDIVKYFDEYFTFGNRHVIVEAAVSGELDGQLVKSGCASSATDDRGDFTGWLGDCCICSPCLTLDGDRNTLPDHDPSHIRRLFAGDVIWLAFIERMGVFQILGAILDAYASNGRLPISNGSLDPGMRDDLIALVLEVMTRQTKMGLSSTVRERATTLRNVTGWTSIQGRKLALDTNVNTGFNTLFHKLIFHALEYFKDKRLAKAIQGTIDVSKPSVATLITIRDTIDVLIKRLEAFSYGRNYYHTLSGIVWAIAGMSVISELATTLGIPPAYNSLDEVIPAAYDILVLKRPVTSGETNRYLVHKECADKGRDIVMDLEVIDYKHANPGGELERWLNQIEAKVEGYRTAYRTLTGVDLGASPDP